MPGTIDTQDIVRVVQQLLAAPEALCKGEVYNMGGPERLSRLDMALKVGCLL